MNIRSRHRLSIPPKEYKKTNPSAKESQSSMKASPESIMNNAPTNTSEQWMMTKDSGELYSQPDGSPPLKETPHIAPGYNKGDMSGLLRSYSTNLDKHNGLLALIGQYIYLNFESIYDSSMTILENY